MDVSNLISNLDYLIFVAVWMMLQNQKKLTNVISELKVAITELTAQVKSDKED